MGYIQVDKIGSVVGRLGLSRDVQVTTSFEPRSGNAVVVRVRHEGRSHQELELADGRQVRLFGDDLLIGALGRRRALRGFAGEVPQRLAVGDRLAVLNRGGVIGASASGETPAGRPVECEVVGMPVLDGHVPNLRDAAIPMVTSLSGVWLPPLVVVSGASMESGKTSLVAELVHNLSRRGARVSAGKLTGVACLRDLIAMQDHGAVATASFLDAGYPSTAGQDSDVLVDTARSVITYLAASRPDIMILELGDGLIGDYGVLDVLRDNEIRRAVRAHIFCANDLAGAWGAQRYLQDHGLDVDLFSGPATDNLVGVEYLESQLGRPAINACRHAGRMSEVVLNLLHLHQKVS